MSTLSEPLIDRISQWVATAPSITNLLLHPDDKEEWNKLRKTKEYQEIAGHLPVKFLGLKETFSA